MVLLDLNPHFFYFELLSYRFELIFFGPSKSILGSVFVLKCVSFVVLLLQRRGSIKNLLFLLELLVSDILKGFSLMVFT
jgi:hypothetical protein